MHRIGEFARLSGAPVKTLRYYDEIGLLCPARSGREDGYRYYTASDLERLNRILALTDIGFSLREVRAMLDQPPSAARMRELLGERQVQLRRKIAADEGRLARAAARIALIEAADNEEPGDIVVRNSPAATIACLRAVISRHAESDELLGELRRRLGGRGGGQGAIWHRCAPGSIDCEVFEFLDAGRPAARGVATRDLPAQKVATLVYRGEEAYLPAFSAIRRWMAAGGLSQAGPKREIYLMPGAGDHEAATEIQFPVA